MTRRGLWIALLALVVLRLAVVACLGDVFGYGEEFTKGAAAKAMLDGLPIEHYRLAYGYHEGGGFAMSHLKAALFAVMGPSVLANKIAAILVAAAILAALVAFAREHLGRHDGDVVGGERVAWLAAAFFVLAPENFVRFSLLNLGTHFEAQLFALLVLHFALKVVREERARTRDLLSLGLAAGFGLFMSLTLIPSLAVAAAAFVLSRRARVFGRETLVALGGFALGAAPLWTMLILAGKSVVVVGGHEATHGFDAFVAALASVPAPILRSDDPWEVVHGVAFVVFAAWGIVHHRRAAHGAVVALLALYTLAYAASGFALEYDPHARGAWFFLLRLTPFWLFGSLLAAHALVRTLESERLVRRVGAAAVVFVALVHGTRDLVATCGAGLPATPGANLARLARTKGYVFPEYFDKMHEHVGGTRDDSVRVLGAYHEDPRRLLPALAQSVFDRWPASPEDALAATRAWFGADAPAAWRGLGRVLLVNWSHDTTSALARVESLPEDTRGPLVEALGRGPMFPYFPLARLEELVARPVPDAWRPAWLRGCGWRAFHTFPYRPDRVEAWIASRPADEQTSLRAGADEARELDTIR